MEKQPPWSKNLLKPNKLVRILAIVPGNRYFAVAVFENYDLIYTVVKTVRCRNTQKLLQKTSEVIADLIFTYQPDLVAQEKLHYIQCKTSDKLQKLVRQIKKVTQSMQVDYLEYPPTFIRQQICQQEKASKKKAFTILAARYSDDLVVKTGTEKLGQDKYRDRLFDAVALGYYCWLERSGK
jgi:Holliday junction resolvasome RuvABC endonuclease subunit